MNPKKTYYFIMGLLGFIPLLLFPLLFSKDFELVRQSLLGVGTALLIVAIGISIACLLLLPRLDRTGTSTIEPSFESQEEIEARIRSSVGQKLAHDLRSPLSVLSILETQLTEITPEHKALFKLTIEKIASIANKYGPRPYLSSNTTLSETKSQSHSHCTLIDESLRYIYASTNQSEQNQAPLTLDFEEGYGLFTPLSPLQIERTVQSMIKVTALIQKTSLQFRSSLRLRRRQDKALLVFTLMGESPKQEVVSILESLFTNLIQSSPESWNGSYTEPESGVLVKLNYRAREGCFWELYFPLAKTPSWFPEALEINAMTQIIICDDDPSIHEGWNQRLNKFSLPEIKHFHSPNELLDFTREKSNSGGHTLYLMDYELNDKLRTGLQLIQKLNISNQSILVTSRFDSLELQKTCEEMGLKLLPKSLFSQIPINFFSHQSE